MFQGFPLANKEMRIIRGWHTHDETVLLDIRSPAFCSVTSSYMNAESLYPGQKPKVQLGGVADGELEAPHRG
jgi:hypothetical protein